MIRLTSIVQESIIKNCVIDYLETNCIIINSQRGFHYFHRFEFVHSVYKMYDDERVVDIRYFDFQKTFDKVTSGSGLNNCTRVVRGKALD